MREMTQEECLVTQGGASLMAAIAAEIVGGLIGAVAGIGGGPIGVILGAGFGAAEWFTESLIVIGTCEAVAVATDQQCIDLVYSPLRQ
jgi:hypothetical protein